ncbi:hypothetical protein SEA_LIFES_105 [Microbacterium phage Lifes]|nr:hypothetical protein SEA_LIFES_105 [Microbacterium phage Lifes]
MNPLVEQMLESTLELIELEDLFAKDCECENLHQLTSRCSKQVVYMVTGCRGASKHCESAVETPVTGVRARMMRDSHKCRSCGKSASECWTIRPI